MKMKVILNAMLGIVLLNACTDKLQELENSCKSNNRNDCLELAHIYEAGKEVKQDYLKALDYYKKTCDLGDLAVCAFLAKTYINGENGISKSNAEGLLYSEKACNLGDKDMCYMVAQSYADGTLSEKDTKKALHYHEKGCELNSGASCAAAGVMYISGKDGIEKNPKKSLVFEEKGCSLNIGVSCYGAGSIYLVDNQKEKAIASFEKACNLDIGDGCKMFLDLNSDPLLKFTLKTKSAAEKLCDLDNPVGCVALATFYTSDNDIVKQDDITANKLVEKACNLKEGKACLILGQRYKNIDKDNEKAKVFFKKACDLNNQEGCVYANPYGVWREFVKKDEFTENTNLIYANSSTDTFHTGYGGQRRATLIARCVDNETTLYIDFDAVMSCGRDMKIGIKFVLGLKSAL
ncbi:tetratricopeptide repeat protein [Succinimonas amylolytica]|uniref:tetratricopeptide repeat protein n=1 Tax=Succinimonas amylolytica TaxID=83769 RepID=UPI0003704709|nr:SEL1-like repeat protein [Succinimonas amylolytica]